MAEVRWYTRNTTREWKKENVQMASKVDFDLFPFLNSMSSELKHELENVREATCKLEFHFKIIQYNLNVIKSKGE